MKPTKCYGIFQPDGGLFDERAVAAEEDVCQRQFYQALEEGATGDGLGHDWAIYKAVGYTCRELLLIDPATHVAVEREALEKLITEGIFQEFLPKIQKLLNQTTEEK